MRKVDRKISVRVTVVASMRNEGPFLLEWVAWYRMLGFTDVVIVTNDCTDHSPQLLDCLQAAGVAHHIRHDVPAGQKITRAKLAVARQHRAVRRSQWVMVCDVDEFLVIHRGEGRIADLISLDAPGFLGMSINWRVFGTGGVESFSDAPVHRQFLLAVPLAKSRSRFVKSIFRLPRLFETFTEHGPVGFDAAKARAKGNDNLHWVNAQGEPWPRWSDKLRAFPNSILKPFSSYEVAQINHYMLRSAETYSLKSGSLSPVALHDRYTDSYRTKADEGDELDAAAFRYSEAFDAEWARLWALPGVAHLHKLCCADHLRAILEKAGRKAEDDPRLQGFLDEAARYPAWDPPPQAEA